MDDFITIPRYVYETERKMRFFGTDAQTVYDNKFNIFIGISISNKKITADMAYNYLKWAVRNAKEKVAVVIADELNTVNYRVFDKYSPGKAENRAQRVGDKFEKLFMNAIKKLKAEDQKKVRVYRWEDIRSSQQYNKVHTFLVNQYPQDLEFQSAVLYFVKKYMRKKGKIIEEKEKIDELATYILGELPTLFEGIWLDGIHYSLCIYPTYFASGMSQFVMDVHADELDIAKELKQLLKSKAALVEAWLD